MKFKKSYLLLFFIISTTTGCSTKSIHLVQNPSHIPLISTTEYTISISKDFKEKKVEGNLKNSRLFIKYGIGLSVTNFIFINEDQNRFQDRYYGELRPSDYKLKSFSEVVNETEFKSEIYTYDFRFQKGGNLMELIDKFINRSCGLVKIYSKQGQPLQVAYGKIVDCAILTMSQANYNKYSISDLLTDLEESAKKSFGIKQK